MHYWTEYKRAENTVEGKGLEVSIFALRKTPFYEECNISFTEYSYGRAFNYFFLKGI